MRSRMTYQKLFWNCLRIFAVFLALLSLLFLISFVGWYLEIRSFPFNSEGNYYDVVSGISYHDSWAIGQLFMAIASLLTLLISFFLYKFATLKSKAAKPH